MTADFTANRVPAELAERLVAARCGPVHRIERLAGAVQNSTFRAVGDGGEWVIKFGSAEPIGGETWALEALPAYGIPVPPLVSYDEAVDGVAGGMLIMQVVAGSAVRPAPDADPDVLRTVGEQLRRLHDIALDGFGPVVRTAVGPAGRDQHWTDHFETIFRSVPDLVTAGEIDAATASRAVAVARQAVEQFTGPGRLLHTDLKLDHLLADRGRLTAIIDWGEVSVGDPVRDLARLSMIGSPLFDHVLDGYGTRIDDATSAVMRGYRLAFNLEAMRSELLHDGDWFAAYRQRIEAEL